MRLNKKLMQLHDIYGKHDLVVLAKECWIYRCKACGCFVRDGLHLTSTDVKGNSKPRYDPCQLNLDFATEPGGFLQGSKQLRLAMATYLRQIGWQPKQNWDIKRWIETGKGHDHYEC